MLRHRRVFPHWGNKLSSPFITPSPLSKPRGACWLENTSVSPGQTPTLFHPLWVHTSNAPAFPKYPGPSVAPKPWVHFILTS